ncbi:SDR family NAD(P)-dependent oxidoreductase [uncultured Sphingobacterium sp.]|uniref:SDR family NAD(P)-dependent oxidoreductase n=1 Tax=uncultured Sphingobacterium sp. TaxID=182688 RepID=UPI003748E6D6
MNKNNYEGALQHKIFSGFDAASTASEVIKGIDLSGKTAIVTGGYAGIGLETTRVFTEAGAKVIVPARDLEKAKKNLSGISNVQIEEMNLMEPSSIINFAEKFLAGNEQLHLLINNAGIMWVPLRRDSRGYESQFSTNYLGHFQLTALLWPALRNAEGARVVNVSSWGHHFSPILFDDPNFEKTEYQPMVGYGQSKTANILFSLELDSLGSEYDVRSYSLHPGGIIDTDLIRNMTKEELIGMQVMDAEGNVIRDPSRGLKTIAQGASTTVWCATNPKLDKVGGVYCENTEIAEIDLFTGNAFAEIPGSKRLEGVMPFALEKEAAKKLWVLSEELTGTKFDVR